MRFEFSSATQILFGIGRSDELPDLASALGTNALLVTGDSGCRIEGLEDRLGGAGVRTVSFAVSGEPTVETINRGLELASAFGSDLVVAVGGGSVIDSGKAISGLLTNGGQLTDYLEVIGSGKRLNKRAAPLIAVPTTAGSGSEVTRNAVIGSPEHRAKVSLRSLLLLPRIALVDPSLTFSQPPPRTAVSGLDALTQLIEPFLCTRSNPMTDALCREGIPRVVRSLSHACSSPSDQSARTDLALGSLFSGLALANAGLGAVHGIAGPLGGMLPIPHGLICARFLVPVMRKNYVKLLEQSGNPAAERFEELARLLTGAPSATADEGIVWLDQFVGSFELPRLGKLGFASHYFPELADKAKRASSMQANIVQLGHDDLIDIFQQAC